MRFCQSGRGVLAKIRRQAMLVRGRHNDQMENHVESLPCLVRKAIVDKDCTITRAQGFSSFI